MFFHSPPIPIKGYGIGTMGQFCLLEASTLIIFVHGFKGASTGTWDSFPKYIREDKDFNGSDIIFYGYDTLQGQAADHAVQLYKFINVCTRPHTNRIIPIGIWKEERNYSRIIIVAHSLGAIICRQAQLFAHAEKNTWVHMTELALFAPAHNGASLPYLLRSINHYLVSNIMLFFRFRYPILNDLDAERVSAIWIDIKEKTKQLIENHNVEFPKAKLVVFAKGDLVVQNLHYLEDTGHETVEKCSHVSVCKPTIKRNEPLIYLKQLINK